MVSMLAVVLAVGTYLNQTLLASPLLAAPCVQLFGIGVPSGVALEVSSVVVNVVELTAVGEPKLSLEGTGPVTCSRQQIGLPVLGL